MQVRVSAHKMLGVIHRGVGSRKASFLEVSRVSHETYRTGLEETTVAAFKNVQLGVRDFRIQMIVQHAIAGPEMFGTDIRDLFALFNSQSRGTFGTELAMKDQNDILTFPKLAATTGLRQSIAIGMQAFAFLEQELLYSLHILDTDSTTNMPSFVLVVEPAVNDVISLHPMLVLSSQNVFKLTVSLFSSR
jgi:hypothetical protein